ncbi:cation:proton antiporter [Haloplanus halobius]|uniref:cation:proton antiporter domain-containing protein n=1 Tax=Haloplanus halobius TaxID=2934938 RepID=UPI00200D8BED|nr:cation:proton antiporter [Haloplanus sp. XH21]
MMAAGGGNLITLVAALIGVGVVAQILSDRFRVPSVVFLLASGVVLGPEVLGIVGPDSFGNALSAIVGLSVAIIVFEGAFHLRIGRLREAPAATFKLVTLGAAIALIGTAAVVHYALDVNWLIASLVGALLVATGPTVIAPILEVVPVRNRVGTALETEGIVNDVTAAILAVVIFEAIIEDVHAPSELFVLFAQRLGSGIVVGLAVAAIVFYALHYVDLSPGNAPQNARLLVLGGALVAYGGAEAVATEAGIAAAATAGIILGNVDVPYEEEITDFKGDITLIVLSFVFITLAALLQFEYLLALGLGGILVAAAVALVIRPLLVFISTAGDRFTRGERLFMSFVGPRGIIPASVATLFAVEFRAQGMPEEANVLVGTVFLVIFLTVALEAGFARQIAEFLDVIPMRVIIIGAGDVGQTLAQRLEDRGENVVLIEEDVNTVETARNAGLTVHHGDGTDTEVLRSAGADNAKIVATTTGDDDVNLLVAQLAESKFSPETILARVNNPANVDAFEDLGVRAISAVDATAMAFDDYIERPALVNWMSEIGEEGEVQEIEVTSEDLIGKSIAEIGPDLPPRSLIALVSRDGETIVPDGDCVLERGDRITVIGDDESVMEALSFAHPDE